MRRRIRRVVASTGAALLMTSAAFVHAGQGGALSVIIEGVPPGGGSLPVMLLRDSFEALLKKDGMTVVEWHKACVAQTPQCQQATVKVVSSGAVAAVQSADANGRVTFQGVPAGRYYLFVMRPGSNGTSIDVWDVAATVQQNPSTIQLTARNLALQNGVRTAVAAAAPPPAVTPASRPVDPSIAKARAAKVDTRVFGIPLGEALQLRECASLQDFAVGPSSAPPSTCLNTLTAALLDFGAAFLPLNTAREPAANGPTILLGKDSCPVWMATCQVAATLAQDALVGVTLITKGPDVEALVAKELRTKYGPPTFSRLGTVTPDTGKEFNTTNLEWVLPGLHVEYLVVRKLEEVGNTRVRTTEGMVRIEIETAYQQRQQDITELTKPKL